jgi:hypothetical protein
MLKHIAIFTAFVLLAGCQKEPPPMTDFAVTLLLRTNETDPIAGGEIKLVFDGNTAEVTTDAKGHASTTGKLIVDRRWYWVNIGFTGLSWPERMDHLKLAAELDHSVRIGDRVVHFPVLYKIDIFLSKDGTSRNPGARVFGRDA